MSSKREQVLLALFAVLKAAAATSACRSIERGEVLPVEIPRGGMIIQRDGAPGTPEITLSPLQYYYRHRAEVELLVQEVGTSRDEAFDTLGVLIGTAIAADRTLGGLCDWVEAEEPEPADLPVPGGATIKAAVVPIILHYTTSNPLT